MNALVVISSLSVLSLLAEITSLKKWLTAFIIIGLIAAAVLTSLEWNESASYFQGMLVFDNLSIAFTGLISVIAVFWFWMSADYFQGTSHKTDRSALILFALSGAVVMTSFGNMSMLFLGIEILSVSLYVLAGSDKESLYSNEAAFKYFLMGSFATGFLLLGMALVYGATGSFNIAVIAERIVAHSTELPQFFYAGVILMLVGLAFKVSAVPFHFWAPDVYEGAPTSVTAFMSTVVKIAAVAAFYRIFASCFVSVQGVWLSTVQVIAVLTLVVANVTAAYQSNVKRMLAYSSVGHVGYILLAFIASPAESGGVIFFYLTAYSIASITAFIVLHTLESIGERITIDDFGGLYKRNPLLAVALTISLLSLAGIPPLAGFFGKYMVFSLAIEHGFTGMVIIAVLTSLVGVYYYFRVIIAMYFNQPFEEKVMQIPFSIKLLLVILIILSLLIGILPDLFRIV